MLSDEIERLLLAGSCPLREAPIGQKRSSRLGVIRVNFVFDVKSTQQCGSIRNTKNLINCGYFLGRTVELKVSIAVCSLRLIVECIGHMGRNTDAHWSIYITAQIICKQRPDLYQCKRE